MPLTILRAKENPFEEAILESFTSDVIRYNYLYGEDISRSLKEVLLTDRLEKYLSDRYTDEGITLTEINRIINRLKSAEGTDYDVNRQTFEMIKKGFAITRDDKKSKLYIQLIDFDTPEKNEFLVVNQFTVQGLDRTRRPDIVVFVNGIPVVVFELKSPVNLNATIETAFKQLTNTYRYDIPQLFRYNAFVVISDGNNNRAGTLFSEYAQFKSWNKVNSEDGRSEGIGSIETMIRGMFTKHRLLAIMRDFICFSDVREEKVLCRYPQFFAATKLLANIEKHLKPEGDGKGGTYFGTTGCGKSFTMLFLTQMLMHSPALKNPTILLITDRNSLDGQLGKLFVGFKGYIGDDNVHLVQDGEDLRQVLRTTQNGGVVMTTIQKFQEGSYELSPRNNIVCISDEAHRSQLNLGDTILIDREIEDVRIAEGYAKKLHTNLPNATYVGFTGTPIDKTISVFGPIVDRYTMSESAKDKLTVPLRYEPRWAKVLVVEDQLKAVEDYYQQCEQKGANPYQVQASKKQITNIKTLLGNPKRLDRIADDFIRHYEGRIEEGATVMGKAIFVCADRRIAVDLYKRLIERRPEWNEVRSYDPDFYDGSKGEDPAKPIERIKVVMTENAKDSIELRTIAGNSNYRADLEEQYKKPESNFKIAIVVDMWLTGFDVPFLDTMYLDKPLKQHNLVQTISRVNRTYDGKDYGLIVDYVGIKAHMQRAIAEYGGNGGESGDGQGKEWGESDEAVDMVKDDLSRLDSIFFGFDKSDYFGESTKMMFACLDRAVEYVQSDEETESRFVRISKHLKQSFNLCAMSDRISQEERDVIGFYVSVSIMLRKIVTGDAPDTTMMNKKVEEMLRLAIDTDEVIVLMDQITESDVVEITDDRYLEMLKSIPYVNTKAKLLMRLLNAKLDEYKRVNKLKGIEFGEKFKKLVDKYNDRRNDDKYIAKLIEEMLELMADMSDEERSGEKMGLDRKQKAMFDMLVELPKKYGDFEIPEEAVLIEMSKEIVNAIEEVSSNIDWRIKPDLKARLKVKLRTICRDYGYPPDELLGSFEDICEQAENIKNNE